jgi:hypothetical protein
MGTPAEGVRVYEKMRTGIWTFNGTFSLVDGWREESNGRLVFKFRLEVDLNHPEFHASSGFCEPAGWSVTCSE